MDKSTPNPLYPTDNGDSEIVKPLKFALIIENTDYSSNTDVDKQSLPVNDVR